MNSSITGYADSLSQGAECLKAGDLELNGLNWNSSAVTS